MRRSTPSLGCRCRSPSWGCGRSTRTISTSWSRSAAERRDQLGALLLPGAHASDWWEAVRKDVLEPLGLPPCAVLPVGPRIAAPEAEALHANGLRWALWEPFSPWELRFVVSMVLIETDPGDSRTQSRVPC